MDPMETHSLVSASPVFPLSASALLYTVAWLAVEAYLRVRPSLSAHHTKRALLAALLLPPVFALAISLSGYFIPPMQMAGMHHHVALCKDIYQVLMGPAAQIPTAVRLVVDGTAWLLLMWGLLGVLRLVVATVTLERGLAPFLRPPSRRLRDSAQRVGRIMGVLSARFFECDIPMGYSSLIGLFRVRCVLSRKLVETASDEELDAIVAHEMGHLQSGDTVMTAVVGAFSCLFFFLRPVRLISRRWRENTELACDDIVTSITGKPLALAAAILRAHGAPVGASSLPTTTLGFAEETACAPDKRVRRLLAAAQRATVAKDVPGASIWQWVATAGLTFVGVLGLLSPQVACTLHCSLEVAGRFLR